PVVAMEARIVRGAAQHAADERQEEAVLPDLVRAGPGGVGVGVIEPVLDERAPVATEHAGEDRRWLARAAAVRVGVPVVRRVGASARAGALVVDGDLRLAGLVYGVGRVLAHKRRVALAVGAHQVAVAVVASAARRAEDVLCEKAADGPRVGRGDERPERAETE